MFNLITKFYKMGIYTKANVGVFVKSGTLTPAQYEEITGEAYSK